MAIQEPPQEAKKILPKKRRDVAHDEAPSLIVDHKWSPMGEWYTRCKHCRMAQAAHAESEFFYYGDED